MNFQQYQKQFTSKAKKEGFDQLEIRRCIDYAEQLALKQLPIIYDTDHFSRLVGYQERYIRRAIVHTPSFYRSFQLTKRNGSHRRIDEPLPSLKEIQLWLLQNVLHKIPVHARAKAYKPTVRLREHLRFHVNQPLVVNVDIADFFPSIRQHSVETIFRNAGYSRQLANLFGKLCTLNGKLPQGAPTSPYLSNLFFYPLDEKIAQHCTTNSIRYTRYADDLTFSGLFSPNDLLHFLNPLLHENGLQLQPKKTKVMRPHQQQTVTGMVVNKKMQVPFQHRNDLRQEMYIIQKHGLDEHLKHKGIKDPHYLKRLMGKIQFVLQLNPTDHEFIAYADHLKHIDQHQLRTDAVKSHAESP
jgi:RNA-directed DNA polymerase